MKSNNKREEILENVQRVVVKVGTSTLTTEDGRLNIDKIKKIVMELSNLQNKGYDVILVTSGAVGAGMGLLNINEKPKTLAEKQMLSAVGQVSLMQIYQTLFKEHNKIIGQLLLTKEEFSNRKRYLNMRNVCNAFLKRKIIPIINENDAIVSNALKIKVGDNDTMSALVSGLIDADLLIILSDIDGLYNKNPRKYEDANLINMVGDINEDIKNMAGAEGSKFGTGGMITKIVAAEMVTKIGTSLVIASGDDPRNITRIVEKENIGTLFVKKNKKISLKKYWLAYGPNKEGVVTIDNGAKTALKNGKSLLSVGIKSVEGNFDKGEEETSYTFENKKAQANADRGGFERLSYQFATSKYERLSDKMKKFNTKHLWIKYNSAVVLLQNDMNTDEPFEEIELIGSTYSEIPLIKAEAVLDDKFDALFTKYLYSNSQGQTWFSRDTNTVGYPPKEAVTVFPFYPEELKWSSYDVKRVFPYRYDVFMYYQKDWNAQQYYLANHWDELKKNPLYKEFMELYFPVLPTKNYKAVLKYRLPNGKITSETPYKYKF